MESIFNNGGIIQTGARDFNSLLKPITPELVGSISLAFTGSASIDISSIPKQAGDVIILCMSVGSSTTAVTLSVAGLTTAATGFESATYSINTYAGFAVSNGTETSYTVNSGSTSNGGVATVQVWRNIDNTTPLDVTPVSSTYVINYLRFFQSPITPVTDGSVIVAMGAVTHNSTDTFTPSIEISNFISTSSLGTYRTTLGVGNYIWDSVLRDNAPYAPDPWTNTLARSSSYSEGVILLALRPAPTCVNSNRTNSGIWNITSSQLAATQRIGKIKYTSATPIATSGTFSFTNPNNFTMSSDGVYAYIMYNDGTNNVISQFTLTTPWDTSKLSTTPTNTFILPADPLYFVLQLTSDGVYLFITSGNSTATAGNIYRYTLTTPFNLSTASGLVTYATATYIATGFGTSPDGTHMILTRYNQQTSGGPIGIDTYSLTTAFLPSSLVLLHSLPYAIGAITSFGAFQIRNNEGTDIIFRKSYGSLTQLYQINMSNWSFGSGNITYQTNGIINKYMLSCLSADGTRLILYNNTSNVLETYNVGEYK